MFTEIKEFYPTPVGLIDKMIKDLDSIKIKTILEPSAGKGDIVDQVVKHINGNKYQCNYNKVDIDTVEKEENLTYILKGKGYKVIHNDFLTLNTLKTYDLIIMNPPFSNGDEHLLKALNMQKLGGKVICILNAETLKNPCTNARKDLVRKLKDYKADTEYLEGEFLFAERETNVEIALIKVNIPYKTSDSIILENLKEEKINYGEFDNSNDLIVGDSLKRFITGYNYEIQAGVNFINEYYSLESRFLADFEDTRSILFLEVAGSETYSNRHKCINEFIRRVRYKYWKAFFNTSKIGKMLTSNLLTSYMSKLSDLMDYDISLYNIYQIRESINKEMAKGVEDCILGLFDELSYQYNYNDEYSKNIHYYNGWKTNKSWYINKKVIIPLNAFDRWDNRFKPLYNSVPAKLLDIEKALNYLSYGKSSNTTQDYDLTSQIDKAEKENQTRKIQLKYFMVTFYKKGTCHIEFTDLDLLKKLNIFGSQQKGWLPPSYGKSQYEDMTEEEKTVINEFEGKKEYNITMENKEYFIYKTSSILQLEG